MAATSLLAPRGREVGEEVGMERRRKESKGRMETSRQIRLLQIRTCGPGFKVFSRLP